ncbi:MAG: DUF4215 domain-containing protein [Byssovorax sp.]
MKNTSYIFMGLVGVSAVVSMASACGLGGNECELNLNCVGQAGTTTATTMGTTGSVGTGGMDGTSSSGGGGQMSTTATTTGGGSVCGDGIKEGDEQCDDHNTGDGDGCSSGCLEEPGYSCEASTTEGCVPICGDGKIVGIEQCDDMNTADGDGCSSKCLMESGFICSGLPSVCVAKCGDGFVVGVEQCDDGGGLGGDGCSADCKIENGYVCVNSAAQASVCSTVCGDGIVVGKEECDGNAAPGKKCESCILVYSTVINEIVYDPFLVGSDEGCFVELRGEKGLPLDGYSLSYYDGITNAETVFAFNGKKISQDGYFVIHQYGGGGGASDLSAGGVDLPDYAGSLVLRSGNDVVDAVSFGAPSVVWGEKMPAEAVGGIGLSLSRIPNGQDTNDNAADWKIGCWTPWSKNKSASNGCQ